VHSILGPLQKFGMRPEHSQNKPTPEVKWASNSNKVIVATSVAEARTETEKTHG